MSIVWDQISRMSVSGHGLSRVADEWETTLANECEISGRKLYECGNCVLPHLQSRRLFGSSIARDTSLFTRVVGVLGKFTLLNVYREAKVIVTSQCHCVAVRHKGVAGPLQRPVTIVLLASHWLKTIEMFSAARNWDESSQTLFSLPGVGEQRISCNQLNKVKFCNWCGKLKCLSYTVDSWNNKARFLKNTQDRHPITCPQGQDMGCLLGVHIPTYDTHSPLPFFLYM